MHAWQLWPETIETAELLVSELITNAIKAGTPSPHARPDPCNTGRISLTLRLLPGRVVIEVTDNDPSPPILASDDPSAESGRGLMLVDALAKEWSYYFPPAGGKVVYCVLSPPDNANTHSTQHSPEPVPPT
jgi:anti-sigma regulatory factor (Ser/Thr protein kinase)